MTNKFGAKQIVDPQGVKWWEINVGKEELKKPVLAFGKTNIASLLGGAAASGALYAGTRESKVSAESAPLLPNSSFRDMRVTPDEILQAKRSIFSEISNRFVPIEVKSMINVAVNKAKAEGKSLMEVLTDPDFFQGTTNRRYATTTGQLKGREKMTWDFVDRIVNDALKGLNDNTQGATHFVHITSGAHKNKLVTMREDEFAKYLGLKGKDRDSYALSLVGL